MSMTLSSSAAAAAALVGNNKDLVCEILSRLPLDSVMLFRLVCKEWRSLLSTQFFIDMQHKNINQTPPCFVVQYFDYCSSTDYLVQYFDYSSSSNHYLKDCTTKKSDHFNTLLFNLDNEDYDHDNNCTCTYMKSVTESINLSSNFSQLEEEEGKIYYKQQGTNTNTNFFSEKTYYHIELISSCGGFLLYNAKPAAAAADMSMSDFLSWLTNDEDEEKEEEDPALILYNPVTKEKHTVTAPSSTHVYCGFYYHSPTKEHRILYQLMFDPHHHEYEAEVVQFLIFGLQTKSTRVLKFKVNNITYSSSHTKDAVYYNHPDTSTPPVISNGSLHWFVSENSPQRVSNCSCSRSILSFGMENEEFRTMPHPPLSHTCNMRDLYNGCLVRHQMNLLEMEGGVLCLCDAYGDAWKLEIYVMEDYKKWTWIRRYNIDLSGYISASSYCVYGIHYKALQILRDEYLLLHYHPKRQWMHPMENHDICHEYALYSLIDKPLSSILPNNKKKQPFQVMLDGYPGDDQVIGRRRLVRMTINSDKKRRAPLVGGNMVVLAPSLASFHHNGTAPPPGIRTFFSIRTKRGYEYISKTLLGPKIEDQKEVEIEFVRYLSSVF